MKVGVLTASISRRAGGLFWSVRSLAQEVRRAGCGVHVFSVADAFSAEDSGQWRGLDLSLFPRKGPDAVGYAPGLARGMAMDELDLLHGHGLWMYPSVVSSQWSRSFHRPVVVSPRGMLDPWAIRNSAWKKRLAGWLFENGHLRRAACLHGLCEAEYHAIRAYGLRNPVAVVPNGVDLANRDAAHLEPNWSVDLPIDARVMLFLSRIHPKKGLMNLLHAWAQARDTSVPSKAAWHLVIAGWDQNGHRDALEQRVKRLGIESTVHFVGPQFEAQKAASLSRADAFVLPSLSEGLPIAVLEAWSYRLPVLMTPQCNLPEGFHAGAAVAMETTVDSTTEGLRAFFGMSEGQQSQMGERGRRLVEERFTWPNIAEQMCEVYAWVLGQESQPACVITD